MNTVELIVEKSDFPRDVENLDDFAEAILAELGIDNWQMGLIITDDEGIRRHNLRWRGLDKATDVLSFVQGEGEPIPTFPGTPREAGDIVVSVETVAANAITWGTSFEEELRRAVVHGILHLNGMDHPGDDYGEGMLKLQEELLERTGSQGENR